MNEEMRDTMGKIRVAIAGVGNCASALIQGIYYYTPARCGVSVNGLMPQRIGLSFVPA